ncbi:DNA polymerase domain-containing protein [Leptospira meyeri]|uniref:DNA polymerase domain-containing protein n=1 Tax=Leptospira meyeri TaxID=29508 RepID=UPI00223DF76D|nr:DNA polymerase domain-containing protein [Leptospira meyeri]MCW7490523.1 DNA polymerase [Leptospira meyeri]
METFKGYLFDIYHSEQKIYLWLRSLEGELRLFSDEFFPTIYIHAPKNILQKLVKRFYELNALAEIPTFTEKRLFYENKTVSVLKLVISKPQLLPKITNKLFNLYGKYDIYHSDIEITTGYMVEKDIYPLAYLEISYETKQNQNQIINIQCLSDIHDLDYEVPNFRIVSLYLERSQRISLQHNTLIVEINSDQYKIPTDNPTNLIHKLNQLFKKYDPDIVLTSYGDQILFPYLFKASQENHIPTEFDRDKTSTIRRSIQTQGTSFNTYGTIVFRAPSYPLFGRWHIDSKNGFVYKEADLMGIIELARISRLPIQKMARASTGKALTYIEVDVALRMNYLVPWQKSALEAPKTALDLLNADKGGLVFQADIQNGFVLENVAQLDFSQMYPKVMVTHNISPETINCLCCKDDSKTETVPSLGYRVCNKRRGVVSEALGHVIERRAHYKKQCKEPSQTNKHYIEQKQSSLKWMLVTSFGYLGYRNAKFGKLESHEAVTAFGREKLILAKEIAEEYGYNLVHAITDCIFIQKKDKSPISESHLIEICETIKLKTKITMDIEGIFSWLSFPPSTQDEKMPVANRYMGRFTDGHFKGRGIALRRKDYPYYIKTAQQEMIRWMCQFKTIADMQSREAEILEIFKKYDAPLSKGDVSWKDLLILRSTSHDPGDYSVDAPSAVAVKDLLEMGIHVQAGEKIRYLVVNKKSERKGERYKTEERIESKNSQNLLIYDKTYYRKRLLASFKEIWTGISSFQNFNDLISDEQPLPFKF